MADSPAAMVAPPEREDLARGRRDDRVLAAARRGGDVVRLEGRDGGRLVTIVAVADAETPVPGVITPAQPGGGDGM